MGTKFTVGVNHLEPDFLLMHMRNRTLGTDFERSRRQRDAIVEIFKQIASEKSISEIYALIDYTFGLVKTNISLSSLTSMATSMIGNLSRLNIESQNVPYSDSFYYAWYKGMSIITYDIADAEKRLNKFIYN
jgi:anionic cell wall polymer biosynthesis LytR-Cps2A-Psr (LCP) family protein